MTDRLTEIAPGVLVATGVLYLTTTTVIAGPDGTCLVIDPAVTVGEVAALADSLTGRGLRPVAGWSTHHHWDHVLWHTALGAPPRFTSPAAAAALARDWDANVEAVNLEAPGHDLSLFGQVTPLDGDVVPWDGPTARVITHDAHAPGHGAVYLPDAGVLVAGDMCSDVEIPLLDLDAAGPVDGYRTGLSRLDEVAGLRWVVPGHGTVGDAAEFRRRVAADHAYLDALERGNLFEDPRVTSDFLRKWHAAQVTLADEAR